MKKNILFLAVITVIIVVIFLLKQFLTTFSGDFSKAAREGKGTESIQIQNVIPNQKITSPLLIKGVARGSWFFEAVFPIRLVAEDGTLLTSGIAKADSDWKTNAFVPFHAQLIFTSLGHTSGVVEFQKDNPSGLTQTNDEFTIPVTF